MATPESPEGAKAMAEVTVKQATSMLESVLAVYGSDTDEGRAILNCLKTLSNTFGRSNAKSGEMVPAEVMNMLSSLPAGGGAPGAAPGGPVPPGATP